MRLRIPMSDKPSDEKIWYLASPYSSGAPWWLTGTNKQKTMLLTIRHEQIQSIASALIEQGYMLIEPIGSCHFKHEHFDLEAHYEYWQRRDRRLIDASDGIIVAMLPGWRDSTGVTDEIDYATKQGKPVWYLDVDTPHVDSIWSSDSEDDNIDNGKIDIISVGPHPIPKVPLDLVPPEALEIMAMAFKDGADKYGPRDWEHTHQWSVRERLAAIQRHVSSYSLGQDIAPDSGLHHMSHVMADAAMIYTAYVREMYVDDRDIRLDSSEDSN